MSLDPTREIDDEVTRTESVEYVQGASGHARLSLGFLAITGVGYWLTGWVEIALGGIAGAFLLSANGFSLYLWDAITEYVWNQDKDAEETAEEATPDEPRTLSVSLTPSTAHKAEFVASVFQVLILVGAFTLIIQLFRRFDPETVSVLLASVLVVGNAGGLILGYLDIRSGA